MAIIINSLTPTSPVVTEGQSVTFFVNAFDEGGATLFYEWQFSADGGVTYSASGLTNNTSTTFQTSNLTQSQSGLYFRVVITNGVDTVFSDTYAGIGTRIIVVTAAPLILALVDEIADDYPVSQTISVGQQFDFTVTASLQNVDVTNTNSNVNNIIIQWQESSDNGTTWTNLSSGGDYIISTSIQQLTGVTPAPYYKRSILTVSNSTFSRNRYRYRARLTYSGAANTPLDLSAILLLVNPAISIYRQPGASPDTLTTQCFKTSIINSGQARVQVGALTSAGTNLTYLWEMSFDGGANWVTANDTSLNCWRLKSGTNHTSDILQIERLIFFNRVGFRCIISGSSGEVTITSNEHYIYPTDVQSAIVFPTSFSIVEDRYGDIPTRSLFSDSIQNLLIEGEINIGRNTGQNGDVSLTIERQNPGSTTWSQVGEASTNTVQTNPFSYPEFPGNDTSYLEKSYTTPPLRRSVDNGAKYRVKATSSAIFTLSGSTKTLTPFYSAEATLNVYRTVYITNQPSNASAYPNASTSFSVSAEPSSGSLTDITYQWQYNTTSSATGWVNIPTGGIYSGVTTNLLQITSVPSTVVYKFFRCVISITNQLSSTISSVAELLRVRDFFTEISNLNDQSVNQFSNINFSVTATSLSAQTPTFQWQKSTNYNPSNPSIATWNNITGATSSSYSILSVALTDSAYYRCRITSFGGEIGFTNAARLTVFELIITLLQDIVTTRTFLEGVSGEYTFECRGLASNSSDVNYQWEVQPAGGGGYVNAGVGNLDSPSNTRFYSPAALSRSQNNSTIRCALTASGIPSTRYTSVCTLTVNRRFTYFADSATKNVTIGGNLYLDINPTWTGGTPTFQWQQSTDGGSNWSNISGETSTVLLINNITSAYNNRQYRCVVNLTDCNQHAYTRNNILTIVSATNSTATVPITINTTTAESRPTFYSIETAKTGAAIGTVIAVPKPSGYVHNSSATTDDITQWEVAVSGSLSSSSPTSVVTSGSVFNTNKPSWASAYNSPSWLRSSDRFPGYIEMRGQYLRATEFPELAKQFGTTYGGTITGTYPRYNSSDHFRLPNTYGKRLLGTGNVNNQSGSTSIIPLYNPNGTSGGDKNIPGSMGGVYNYRQSQQLPPGSPGISGQPDGTADGSINATTFNLGSFRTTGFEETNVGVQPRFSGTVTYALPSSNDQFSRTPVHGHSAVVLGGTTGYRAKATPCRSTNTSCVNGCGDGAFFGIQAAGGEILEGPYGVSDAGRAHNHPNSGLNGSFDMVREGGMNISDTTFRMSNQSRQLFDNSLRFYLRNNEAIPMNAPYFRLKYLIKAY